MRTQNMVRISAVLAVIAAVVIVILMKRADDAQPIPSAVPTASAVPAPAVEEPPLPKLVDLGSDTCIPCKKMAPILDELKAEFAGRFDVEFINVRKEQGKANLYGLSVIPTQIFLDAEGNQLLRHAGFFSRADILAAWKELGYDFETPGTDIARGAEEIDHQVIAYYFHGDMRCITCLAIEDQARTAIEKAFAQELESGTLQWRPINYDQPDNQHFIEEYDLATSSLVLVHADNGEQMEWKILADVWELVDLIDSFDQYVEDETRAYVDRHL